MKFLELLPKDSDYYNTLLKKLSPPLVTLLSGEPEVQYVALRNINLIVQKRCVITRSRGLFFTAVNFISLLPMMCCFGSCLPTVSCVMSCFACRPEILKQEIKVFFVKYNDPIYVKLEKLDIMIRLASQANIAQVHYTRDKYFESN